MIGTTAFLNRSWKECIFKREDPWNIKATLLALLQWYSNGNLTFAWVNRLKENSEQSVLYFLQLLLAHLPICLWLHRSRAIKIEASRKFIPLFLLLHCNLGTCFPPRKREFFPLGLANALTERNKEGAMVGGRARACDNPGPFPELCSVLSVWQIALAQVEDFYWNCSSYKIWIFHNSLLFLYLFFRKINLCFVLVFF